MTEMVIEIRGLAFSWDDQPPLLEIESFDVCVGERVFLRGPSGSGKSTLLGLIAGVLSMQKGALRVAGRDLGRMSGTQRDQLRADNLGVIFQMFNLVPYLSLLQNVILPCRFSAKRLEVVKAAGGAEAEARRLLARLGIEGERMLKRPVTDLSVGQQQRVAAARALIGGPRLIIADEPTSALDSDTRDRFIELLSEEAEASGAAMLFVSHDASLAPLFDRAVDLSQINSAVPKVM